MVIIIHSPTQTAHLHIANRDAKIPAIPHNLILDFLPALHTLLNEHLWARSKCLPAKLLEFRFVLHKPSAESTERIRSADDDGVPDLLRSHKCLIGSRGGRTLWAPLANLEHGIGEPLSCLGAQAQDDEHVRKRIVPHQVKPTHRVKLTHQVKLTQ